MSAMTGTAIRNGTSGGMMTDEGSGAMAIGMKTRKDVLAKIDAITMHGSLLGLWPYHHDA